MPASGDAPVPASAASGTRVPSARRACVARRRARCTRGRRRRRLRRDAAPGPPCAARLAQRAGGQQPAVADAAVVEHADLDVARQRVVLQAVVADDDLRGRMRASSARAASARLRATNTGTPSQLVTSSGSSPTSAGVAVRRPPRRSPSVAAVAARHHAHLQAARVRCRTTRHHHRRLARAAGDHVADHDDGHRHALVRSHPRR
jgi:hypothetical protein